jgi:uncharacterized paraquat-inducible protein A
MAKCDCSGMEFICNRWVFTGRCTHDLPTVPKGCCPTCGKAVAVAHLDYGQNTQETECPNGHRVIRHWKSSRWTEWKETTS